MRTLVAQSGGGDGAVLILLAWVVLGPWVGYLIGNPKGRGSTGVVLGLLLGVLGWIIMAVLPPLVPPTPVVHGVDGVTGNLQAGLRRPCPFCAEDIKFEAKLCPFCKSEVEAITIEPVRDPYWRPAGWSTIPVNVFRYMRDKFPKEMDQLRDAHEARGGPTMNERQVKKCLTQMRSQRLSGEDALRMAGF